jgi:deoxyribodipyrimidine photolyase
VAGFEPESVATFNQNQWQSSTGIGGRFQPESVAAFNQNMHEEGQLLVAEAMAAHQAIQELMLEVQASDVDFAVFEARFLGLMEAMEAHMAAEENALFPFAAEDLADRLESLRDEMVVLKQQLTTGTTQ